MTIFNSARTLLLTVIATISVVPITSSVACAQKEATVYTFQGGSDGDNASYGLIADSSGSLYGTTYYGGYGNGTVFQLTPQGSSWVESVLYRFTGYPLDGNYGNSGLVRDSSGALYGVTYEGGSQNCGVAYKLALSGGSWVETVIHDFTGGFNGNPPDGCGPYDNLIIDSKGVLYGTTRYNGANGGGTVYSLTLQGSSWNENSLFDFSFDGTLDGASPIAGVVFDKAGNLYGTTQNGGKSGTGVVFELSPTGQGGAWTETLLYQFTGGKDGGYPSARLVFDKVGGLYGTTQFGGLQSCVVASAPGCGTVFQLTPNGGAWTEKVLYAFKNANDGAEPIAPLIFDGQGALYGTAAVGGTSAAGAAFRLLPPSAGRKQWQEQTLHDFGGPGDGSYPTFGGFLMYKGAIYNTTGGGGASGSASTIYEISR